MTILNTYFKEKVALVTERDLSTVVNVADFATPGIELQYFPLPKRQVATDWLAV